MRSRDSDGAVVPRSVWTTILPARSLINAQFRIAYPFLPAISRGLGVPLEVASLLLTIRGLIGVSSPLFGYLSDRLGRKTIMVFGLLTMMAGAALLVAGRSFGVALVAFGLQGLAKPSYDPAMQAHVSDLVPYEHRGRALGITEYSWAGSWLLGVPIAGLLIARAGWQAPSVAIVLLGLICVFATARLRNVRGPDTKAQDGLQTPRAALSDRWKAHVRPLLARDTLTVLAVSALVILASENFFIIYGVWMENQFGLAPVALGAVSIVVSLAELSAAILSSVIVDRLGKRRALLGGLAANTCAYLLLPVLATGFRGGIAGLVLLALTAEFSIVTVLPLVSELSPTARGTVLAVNTALMSLAAATASLAAPRLWAAGRLELVTWACAAGVALAGIVLALTIAARRRRATPVT
jgi:predicted MFS family arabinose efflux permease